MSRDKNYQRLLNSKRWKQLRAWKLERNPLCELCEAEGKVSAAVDVHHIDPIEGSMSLQEMEARCFNPNNLQCLCIPCHRKVHTQMRSNTKEGHQQRQADEVARWLERNAREK